MSYPVTFTPTQGAHIFTATNILAGSLSVIIWDILDNIVDECRLIFKSPFSIVTLSYFVSRIGSVGYAVASNLVFSNNAIWQPTEHCIYFSTIIDAWYPIGLSFSGLLFFFRLRAIYNRNRVVIACFFVLWLGLFTCTLLFPMGILGGFMVNTEYCPNANSPNSSYVAIFAPLIHDTLVFIAITWRLAQNTYINMTVPDGFHVVIFGKYLPAFSKGLLLDGQRYYLISLISNLIALIMAFNTSASIPVRSMGATTNIVITNIMACRVFRRTKFGEFREEEISTSAMQSQKLTSPIRFVQQDGDGNTNTDTFNDTNRPETGLNLRPNLIIESANAITSATNVF